MVQLKRRKNPFPGVQKTPEVRAAPPSVAVGWIQHSSPPQCHEPMSPGSLPSCLAPPSPHGARGCRDCPGDSRKEVGRWPWLELIQAGAGSHALTCSPLSPGMPGTPRAPGTDCPGGPLSPCKGHMLRIWLVGAGASLLSPESWMCCFPHPCTSGMPVQVGMGTGPAQLKDKQGPRPLRLPSPGQGDTREEPKAIEPAGQDRGGT